MPFCNKGFFKTLVWIQDFGEGVVKLTKKLKKQNFYSNKILVGKTIFSGENENVTFQLKLKPQKCISLI